MTRVETDSWTEFAAAVSSAHSSGREVEIDGSAEGYAAEVRGGEEDET